MPHGAQGRGCAICHFHQACGHGQARCLKNTEHFRQFPHGLKLVFRAAGNMAAIGMELLVDFQINQPEVAGQKFRVVRNGHSNGQQTFQGCQRAPAPCCLWHERHDGAGFHNQRGHQALAKMVIRCGCKKFVVGQPCGKARAGNGRVCNRAVRGGLANPDRHHAPSLDTGGFRAKFLQVSQPCKALQPAAVGFRPAWVVPLQMLQVADHAFKQALVFYQTFPHQRVSRPEVP